jgi:TRAP-type C4-dicarboxylate transport system permease small subunit
MNPIHASAKGLVLLAEVSVVLMLVLVVADVLARGLFNVPIPGTEAIVASYLMVATIFLPLALLQVLDEHIAVDALYGLMPRSVQHGFVLVAHLCALAFYAVLGWIYYHVAVEAVEIREFVSGTWNVPIWPARLIMPLGLALAAVSALARLLLVLRLCMRPTAVKASHPKNPGR